MPGPRQAAPQQPSPWQGDRGGHLWAKDRETITTDGTRIRYTVRGPEGAPWVVAVPGFLCPDTHWRDIAPDLATAHRVALFNHRGTGASSEAYGGRSSPDAAGYRIERLATDVMAVLEAEAIDVAILLGHSMGVQVSLQVVRICPERVAGLVLVAGGHTSPFRTMYGGGIGSWAFPIASIGVPAIPSIVGRRLIRAVELPVAMPVGRILHAIGERTPMAAMTSYQAHLSRIDHRTAIWTARGMDAFDATDWLETVDVPAEVLVGTDDGWCPVAVARQLANGLERGHLTIVEGASHTLPLEFPDRVVEKVHTVRAATGQ